MATTIWTTDHVDFLERLARDEDLSGTEMATRMSRQFHVRITPSNVNALLHRMRKPGDAFYRNLPYRRRGARYTI
jgi:hypothetical protein